MLKKKLFRELRLNAGQFTTIFLMVMIASLAFAGVHAYMDGMEDSGNRYYTNYNLEDLWLTGENFSVEDLEKVKQVPNVKNAERVLAFQCTWIRPEGNVTIETNFIETNEISHMYVFEGEGFDPEASGLWLDYYLAQHLGIHPGDEIPLSYGGYTFTEKVLGLIGTPDHVYAVKDSSVIFTDHKDFGFAYLSAKEFPAEYLYDQIIGSEEMTQLLDQAGAIAVAWKIAKATGSSAGDFLSSMSSLFADQANEEDDAADGAADSEEAGTPDGADGAEGTGADAEAFFDLDKVDLDKALEMASVIKSGNASIEEKEAFLKALDPEFEISKYQIFPQILVDVEDTSLLSKTKADLEAASSRILAVTDRKVSLSWAGYQSEIEEGQTYSTIFMGMFLFIAILSVVTTMNRFVKKQRTSIGTLKALGYRKRRIIRHYVGFGLVTGLLGVIAGIIIGVLTIGMFFLKEEMDMFLVPDYTISIRPIVFAVGAAILAVITLVTYLSCRKILQEPAAQALRVERPKVKVKKHAGEKAGLLKNASFATKWNLRDIGRNRTRSLMAIAGIAGSCILIITAFGMKDSLNNYLGWEFEGILHFDYQLALKSDYSQEEFETLTAEYGDKTSQTLPIEFVNGDGEKETNIVLVNDAPGLLQVSDHDRNPIDLKSDGVYVTEKLAENSHLQEGGNLKWHILGEDEWFETPITGLNRDPQNQQVTMTRTFLEETLGKEYKPDMIYTDEDLEGVDSLPGVETISSVTSLASQMNSMLSVMSSFIWLLVGVSALLGFVIIYNMGILSLSENNYQFATLKVLGFRYKAIRKVFIRQNLWLTVISILIGIPGGYWLTNYIFTEAIGDNYDFFAMINLPTYVIGAAGTLAIALFSTMYLARKLKKIDMVSSLKANE